MKKIELVVISESFNLYESFKRDVKELGILYNSEFTQFNKPNTGKYNCMFLSNKWSEYGFEDKLALSLSNYDNHYTGIVFKLETQYGEALKYVKSLIKPKPSFKNGDILIRHWSNSNIGMNDIDICVFEGGINKWTFNVSKIIRFKTTGIINTWMTPFCEYEFSGNKTNISEDWRKITPEEMQLYMSKLLQNPITSL